MFRRVRVGRRFFGGFFQNEVAAEQHHDSREAIGGGAIGFVSAKSLSLGAWHRRYYSLPMKSPVNGKRPEFVRFAPVWMLLGAVLAVAQPQAVAQGTAFTYQGRLNQDGAPANGLFDLRFALYDSTNLPGGLLAGPVTNASVAVSNGLFTTALNFGNVFTGASNWLDIAVSASGSNSFTALLPRQPLTPSPYAIFAGAAAAVTGPVNASQLSGTLSPTNFFATIVTNFPEVSGALPKTNNFVSHGGRLLIFATGNGYPNTGTIVGMAVQLDGVSVGTNKAFLNGAANSAFVSKPIVCNGVAAGAHSIVLTALPNTITDVNSYFSVTVQELPY